MTIFTDEQINQFLKDGYIHIPGAFNGEIVNACQNHIWNEITTKLPSVDRDDPTTWTEEFIRLDHYDLQCYLDAANTPKLLQAFDEIVGPGNWLPRKNIGSFPIRFPSDRSPAWADWHIDGSIYVGDGTNDKDFPLDYPYYVNLVSDGRAALILFLFSDQETPESGAVKIAKGSHKDVPKLLADAGEKGMHPFDLRNQMNFDSYEIAHALGKAGDVYLLNPFTFHSGQANTGNQPRFLGQPELTPANKPCFNLNRENGNYSVMERSVLLGL